MVKEFNWHVGFPCAYPTSGGSCVDCGYPRAYVHPDCREDAFRSPEIYLNGTAMVVRAASIVPRGEIRIARRDFGGPRDLTMTFHPIPPPWTRIDANLTDWHDGRPCAYSSSGGSCVDCRYPRAYVHPDCYHDALLSDAIVNDDRGPRATMLVFVSENVERGKIKVYSRVTNGLEIHIRDIASAEKPAPPAEPEPTTVEELYDGLTAGRCAYRWLANRVCIENGWSPLFALTPSQAAIGRADFQRSSSAQSCVLRDMVKESAERDRARATSVVMSDPDLELANCRDAE